MKKNYTGFDSYVVPAILFVGIIILVLLFGTPKIILGPGVKVPEPPLQTDATDKSWFTHEDYSIRALANYHCKAKLISSKTYSDDWSDICPIDYTLGWQQLSDEDVLRHIHFSQRRRWTYFRTGSLPDTMKSWVDITRQSANVHMCPATDEICSALRSAPIGGIIEFEGKLIELKNTRTNAPSMKSSTSRTDTQGGACEIVWVEKFKVLEE